MTRWCTSGPVLRKGRPHADAIRALAPAAIQGLSEPRRSLLRAYYGLDGTAVCSYRHLGQCFGLSAGRVGDLVRDAVQHLLGPGPAGRVVIPQRISDEANLKTR